MRIWRYKQEFEGRDKKRTGGGGKDHVPEEGRGKGSGREHGKTAENEQTDRGNKTWEGPKWRGGDAREPDAQEGNFFQEEK